MVEFLAHIMNWIHFSFTKVAALQRTSDLKLNVTIFGAQQVFVPMPSHVSSLNNLSVTSTLEYILALSHLKAVHIYR